MQWRRQGIDQAAKDERISARNSGNEALMIPLGGRELIDGWVHVFDPIAVVKMSELVHALPDV
jgi:hypothetical protein